MYTLDNRNIFKPQHRLKSMKTIELLKILQEYPLFTENDVAKIVDKNASYVKTMLYRLRKRKLIHRVERGKYTVHDDVLVFASHIVIPSYISLWTALRHYNLTEQLPKTVFVVVPKHKEQFKFHSTLIEFVKSKHFFGFRKERYRDFDIFIAEPEKAAIDSLLSKKIPLDEIVKAIKTKELKTEKLIDYSIKTKNKSLIKRLGFILEEAHLECKRLNKFVDNNYICLDLMLGRTGRKNNKWRIIDNRR